MEKYAKVIVNNNSSHTDELYTYKIPGFLIDEVQTGHRVLISFGRTNKPIEGFVFDISTYKDGDFRVKEVIDILDKDPILKRRDIELVRWMREEYICTFMDAINCIYPKGSRITNYKVAKLISCGYDNASLKEQILIDEIKNNKNEIKIDKLLDKFGKSVNNTIKKLKDKKILDIYWEYKSIKNEKYIHNISLNFESDIDDLIESLNKKRAFKQAQIIEFLKKNDNAEINDIMSILNITKSSINSLEKKDT